MPKLTRQQKRLLREKLFELAPEERDRIVLDMAKELDNDVLTIAQSVSENRREFLSRLRDFHSRAEIVSLVTPLSETLNTLSSQFRDFSESIISAQNEHRDFVKKEMLEGSSKFDKKIRAEVERIKKDFKDFGRQLEELSNRPTFVGNTNSFGGSAANFFNSGTLLSKVYSDINLIAGTGITISAANNNTTKRIDLTITGNATTTPAGSNGDIQFNNGGSFGANGAFVWDNANSRLGINNTSPSYALDVGEIGNGTGGDLNLVVNSSGGFINIGDIYHNWGGTLFTINPLTNTFSFSNGTVQGTFSGTHTGTFSGTLTGTYNGGTASADAFYINSSDVNGLIAGFIPDAPSNPIIDFGINAGQFGGRDDTQIGSIFRLDSRGTYPFFNILYQKPGSGGVPGEVVPFKITTGLSSNTNNSVMIGTGWSNSDDVGSGGGEDLQVYNNVYAGGYVKQKGTIKGLVTKTSAYTIAGTDYAVLVNSTSATVTITLPTAVGITGQEFVIKDWKGQAATHNITVNTTSSQTIDGSTSKVLSTNYSSVRVISDGANWATV